MRLVVNCGQLIQIQVRVPLRRRQARMTQHLLDDPQVSAAVKQMRRKGMAQSMGSHFDSNPRLTQMLFDDARHTPGRDPGASMV